MSSATVGNQDRRSQTSAVVSRTVRTLMAWHGITQTQVADAMGLTQPAVSKRLRGVIAWDTDDLDVVARLLKVTPGDLCNGLPQLDSNQQPADWGTEQMMPDTPSEGLWSPLPVAA